MAKSSIKSKMLGVNLPVPQNRDEAANAVRAIGELSRQIARIEADMNDTISARKLLAAAKAAPLREQINAHTEGLKVWSEANRVSLTNGNKVKFFDLGTGKIFWRLRPPSVRISNVERVIEAIKSLGFSTFLRTTEEINKEALLADKDKARLVAGISIGSEGEDFLVEPFEVDLEAKP